jgi:branched-chain amino acid transport system ATP-binding protein
MAQLEIKGVYAGYGSGGDILRGVDLEIDDGGFACLIGPNGAGKSTLLRAISGALPPRRGRILFEGADISGRRPDLVFRQGIVTVPQGRNTFPQMTVWENMLMGAYTIRDRAEAQRRINDAASLFPIVAERRSVPAGNLSAGQQKQVEIARALVASPRLLLLDEPTLGLEPRLGRMVMDKARELNARGITILLVEQNARMGLAAARDGLVMELGQIKLRGAGEALLADPEVARLYLGTDAAAPLPAASR